MLTSFLSKKIALSLAIAFMITLVPHNTQAVSGPEAAAIVAGGAAGTVAFYTFWRAMKQKGEPVANTGGLYNWYERTVIGNRSEKRKTVNLCTGEITEKWTPSSGLGRPISLAEEHKEAFLPAAAAGAIVASFIYNRSCQALEVKAQAELVTKFIGYLEKVGKLPFDAYIPKK